MRIEFDSERFDNGYRVITVDGVAISIDLLSILAHPNPDRLYSMERVGDDVMVIKTWVLNADPADGRPVMRVREA